MSRSGTETSVGRQVAISNVRAKPLAVVAALLVLSAPLYFVRGIGIFDDSLYLKAGQLVLDGLTPYKDFYDNKPPGIYYLSAAIAAVGGRGWLAPRIFLFLFAALFQFALVRWIERQFGTRPATAAAVLLGLSYPLCQGYSLHTEPFGAAAAFAGCAILLANPSSMRTWFAAGALLGVSTIFKQTGVLYVAAFGAFALFEVKGERARLYGLAARLGALVSGVLAALAPVALAFAVRGIGRNLLDSVVIDAVLRAADARGSFRSIVVTWVRCPALIVFLGVAALLAISRQARESMAERKLQAFVLFASVGICSTLPTLKLNGVGHYLQPGAFAFAAACALFLDGYVRRAPIRSAQAVTVAAVTLLSGYGAAVAGGSLQALSQNRLRSDLALQRNLREVLDARLGTNEKVLCLSTGSAARLYLMSGRRPFNRSLYYYPTIDRIFSLDDARRLLLDGRAPAALVDIDPGVPRPELNDQELATLRATYEIIPLDTHTDHRLLALVRHDRQAARTTTE